MSTKNQLAKGVISAMLFSMVLFNNLNAQHMGGQDHTMNQGTMQHMNQQMINMQHMMNNLDGMMDRTSNMMNAMHDMTQMDNLGSGDHMHHNGGDMGGNGGDMGGNGGDMGGMMNMIQGMDQMTKDMQGFINQMDNIMGNTEMMKDPLMREYMENMQEHMDTAMSGYDGVITSMEKIQILNSK